MIHQDFLNKTKGKEQEKGNTETLKYLRLFLPLRDSSISDEKKLEILNEIVKISEEITSFLAQNEEILSSVLKTLRLCITQKHTIIRAAALRTLRFCITTEKALFLIIQHHIDIFVIRSLEFYPDLEMERIQALKLIWHCLQISPQNLPRSFVQSLVSISEFPEDTLRKSCIGVLCEIGMKNPQLLALSRGVLTLARSSIDPSLKDYQKIIVETLTFLLNDFSTRQFVSQKELNIILSPFTSVYSKNVPKDKLEICKASRKAIDLFMKDWSGFFFIASNSHGLGGFLQALKLPARKIKTIALKTLYDIFRYTIPKKKTDKDKEKQKPKNESETATPSEVWDNIDRYLPPTPNLRHNLLNNYFAILFVAFKEVGLIETLIEVGKESNHYSSVLATKLLGELLHKSNELLATHHCALLHSLPDLFKSASNFSHSPSVRVRANFMLNSLDRYARTKKTKRKEEFHISLLKSYVNRWETENQLLKIQRQIEKSTADQDFEILLKESKVILYNDAKKWDFQVISGFLEGIINNPKRIEACIKNKFFKRLLKFYQPTKKQFSEMPHNSSNIFYVRVGCRLLEVLLSTKEGYDFLKANNTITEIASGLRMEIQGKTGETTEQTFRFFHPANISKTLSGEYLTFLGVLSTHPKGMELLLNLDILLYVQAFTEMLGREEIARIVISSLDYTKPNSKAREILERALIQGSKLSRIYSTKHLQVLFRVGVEDFHSWAIKLLVGQLKDSDENVRMVAIDVLDECCADNIKCLDSLIDCHPSELDEMGEQGKTLLIRFLSRQNGIQFLKEIGFIGRELKQWIEVKSLQYTKNIENAIFEVFHVSPTINISEFKKKSSNKNSRSFSNRNTITKTFIWRTCANRRWNQHFIQHKNSRNNHQPIENKIGKSFTNPV
eukprot:Anaeramoba_ignava/c21149_g1_i1.p1 GENE.c21149_g1_i1~~c21149_g1_i1.p1  ORF type:complete len:900 (+),score=248.70 c21149_g1_i1:10-2709(+)